MKKDIEELVVLVDDNDNQRGIMEKLEAHKKGFLHRAVSIFVCNSKGEWLLQQRAMNKYYSGGLWANTCCSHPYPKENYLDAAKRCLLFEMGLATDLEVVLRGIYKENLDNSLNDYKLDNIYIGITDELPNIQPNEVMDYKYVKYGDLEIDFEQNLEKYTLWFRKIAKDIKPFFDKKLATNSI